jgi:mannose-6-phosphate isomerase-like protein (cupin superfamily)
MDVEKVNIAEKLSLINEYWRPRIAGALNGQQVKLVKFAGEFPWHAHDGEDELFLVIKGGFRLEIREGGRDRAIELGAGEFAIVPRGIEHRPVAEREVHVLLLEPAGTVNTGALRNEFTTEARPV